MKKYIISILSLFSAFALNAEEKPFTSFGSTWLQANIGANNLSVANESESGVAVSAELNLGLFDLSHIGIDLALGANYSNFKFANNLNADNYAGYIEVKPYLNIYRGEDFALTLFFNPFAGYNNVELSVGGQSDSADWAFVGIKTGVEISFLNDFYITPAYKYTRYEAIDSNVLDFDTNSAEIDFGFRLTSWVSLHLKYSHIFEKEVLNGIKVSSDEITAGIRLTF